MIDPTSVRLAAFEQALRRLEEGLARPADDIVRDGCIQRFEFTFEMAWRALQAYAAAEGVECVSPRDCFRAGFRLALIDRDAPWIAMVEDRNRTAHTYNEETAKAVYGALPAYATLFRRLLERFQAGQRQRASDER
jgi:nucleotidyltransferase substrate binding protein (TIGR01987 family)